MSMYTSHTTRDGDTMMICQMTPSHLINTIRMYCNHMVQAREVLANAGSMDVMTKILANQDCEEIRRQAEQEIRRIDATLSSYVFEAALRGINVSTMLQAAYGRTNSVPRYTLAALAGVNDDKDSDDGDDNVGEQLEHWYEPTLCEDAFDAHNRD